MDLLRRVLQILLLTSAIVTTALAADAPSTTPDDAIYGISPSAEQRGHWSFQSLKPVALPASIPAVWERNPIDAFIWQKLTSKQLTPSASAEPRVWLRRVYFDLIGLPPTPAELDEFLADPSEAVRGRVVDKLLADPGYGVRWGRRWLDLVRYADTNGYERDGDKPSAWRYRNYVIGSLNADIPFSQFLTEQLAGDEIENVTADSMIATSFLRLGTWDDEPADPVVDRYDQLDDVVRGVSTTFLGLSLSCARCHNHKFEPLSQIDYARMLAVFAPLERPRADRTEFDLPVGAPADRKRFQALQSRADEASKQVNLQVTELEKTVRERVLAGPLTDVAADLREALRAPTDKRNEEQKQLLKKNEKRLIELVAEAYTADERRQRDGFQVALKAIRETSPAVPKAYIFQEQAAAVPPTQVFRRGDPTTPAGVVDPGVPVVLTASPMLSVTAPKESSTSGRRLALARWMTDPANPLVARVIVNRLWQGHFGEGLVHTENDFGVMGYPPTHPELLDWLANRLIQGNWKLKDLHRHIVLSNTYGQASGWREEAGKIDQSNNYLWRFPYRRLDAEPIRDAVLATNGTLNPKLGGPGVYPKIAAEVLASQSRPGNGWGKSSPEDAARRSVFIFVKRSLLVPFFELMDLPDTTTSCEQRNVSTIPTQALTLLNSEFMNEQARVLAARLQREAGKDLEKQVTLAYRLTLGRSPQAEELAVSVKFVQQRQATSKEVGDGALAAFCLVLYNLNEFFYID
ncbi:MAG: hypothetical protein JWN70_903 [Planctomycetaceae bacterium]|nr:hypothetical protein [Planctomycetaceae bacterium]